jgi:histidyl-tRNA synthetase
VVAEPLERLERYFACLHALGVSDWVELDLSIVRGLAYYTGIVFELFDRKGEFRAICGGGRYDTLLQSLGGVDLPALGFGMGDVVLGELLKARGLMPSSAPRIDYWVAGDEESRQAEVMRVAAALRDRGRSVEFALRPQTLSRQLKTAVAAGAERAVILRAEDAARGTATVRTLGDGGEALVTLAEWLPGA